MSNAINEKDTESLANFYPSPEIRKNRKKNKQQQKFISDQYKFRELANHSND